MDTWETIGVIGTIIVATLTLVATLVRATWTISDKIADGDKMLGDNLGNKITANATAIGELRGTVSGLRDVILSHVGEHNHPTVVTKSENSE